jgi:hypothetical protein
MKDGKSLLIVFGVFYGAAIVGSVAGGIIGIAVAAPGTGALVGGALGAGAGALAGDQLLEQEHKRQRSNTKWTGIKPKWNASASGD